MCAKAVSCLYSVCVYVVRDAACAHCAKLLLLLFECASFNRKVIALLLLRFLTVYELKARVKRCYCSLGVDEIVLLF